MKPRGETSIAAGGSGRVVAARGSSPGTSCSAWARPSRARAATVPFRLDASLGARPGGLGGLLDNVKVPLKYEGELDLASLLRNPEVLTSPAARKLATQAMGSFFGF